VFPLTFLLFVPAILLVGLFGFSTSRLRYGQRLAAIVVVGTLLLTPIPGVATIVVFPIPLGLLLGTAAMTGAWSEIGSLVVEFPLWWSISVPATAAVSYGVARYLLSNKSLERTREG
jgi:hypothetical protein